MIADLAIVLVAAGSSTRMGFPKLWTDVCGAPLVARAVSAARSVASAELVLVVSGDRLREASALGVNVVAGGARRRDSVTAGMRATSADWLAIHDAARALAPPDLFHRGLDAARTTGAAIPVLPLKDTIKHVRNGHVVGTPPRAEHFAVQTPQIFRRDLLERALASTDDDMTDEAALLEQLGVRVATFDGDERAFKVTTPFDFKLAGFILTLSLPIGKDPSSA